MLAVISCTGWWKVLHHDRWLTLPHRMTWVDDKGAKIEAGPGAAFNGCYRDIRAGFVVSEAGYWVSCLHRTGDNQKSAFALFDPAAKTARLAWSFPTLLDVRWTKGLMPGPNGTLGLVMQADGQLVAAVAGPQGWLVPPTHLGPANSNAELHGLRLSKDTLEVAITPHAGTRADLSIPSEVVSLRPGTPASKRPIPLERAGCDATDHRCSLFYAYAPSGDHAWHYLIASYGTGQTVELDVDEQGKKTPIRGGTLSGDLRLDAAVAGITDWFESTSLRLQPDGSIVDAPPPPASSAKLLANTSGYDFVVKDGHLERLRRYWVDGEMAFLHVVGERRIVTRLEKVAPNVGVPGTPAYEDVQLILEDVTNANSPRRTRVARIHDCGDLWNGMILPAEGGYLLIAPSGCYVEVNHDLERTDPRGIMEHLLTRGSMYEHWEEPWHAWYLAWVLFGLPLAGLAAAAAWRRARQRGALVGCGLAAVTGGVALLWLWPLLM